MRTIPEIAAVVVGSLIVGQFYRRLVFPGCLWALRKTGQGFRNAARWVWSLVLQRGRPRATDSAGVAREGGEWCEVGSGQRLRRLPDEIAE